jgi:hypothetical protein
LYYVKISVHVLSWGNGPEKKKNSLIRLAIEEQAMKNIIGSLGQRGRVMDLSTGAHKY